MNEVIATLFIGQFCVNEEMRSALVCTPQGSWKSHTKVSGNSLFRRARTYYIHRSIAFACSSPEQAARALVSFQLVTDEVYDQSLSVRGLTPFVGLLN